MKFQHAYSEPCRNSDLECCDCSLTQQQFAQDTDINVMLERFKVTGQMPTVGNAVYADFTQVGDFRQSMESLRRAQAAFLEVPAHIRAKFGNDPGAFSEFCLDKQNLGQLREWGLAPPSQELVKPPEAS